MYEPDGEDSETQGETVLTVIFKYITFYYEYSCWLNIMCFLCVFNIFIATIVAYVALRVKSFWVVLKGHCNNYVYICD